MWPLYLLYNKPFKAEEEKELEQENSDFLGISADEKPLGNGKRSVSLLPGSHFVEVSVM